MKKQILVVHGAGVFARIDRTDFKGALDAQEVNLGWLERGAGNWKDSLVERLGEDEYEAFFPKMPDADNPHYDIWKLWFEKVLEKLSNELIIIGHSLGGAFVLKYFAEEEVYKKITGLFAVAAPYLSEDAQYQERGFAFPENKNISAEKIFLYYSADDPLVNIHDATTFKKHIPTATVRELDGRGHFNKDDFPEIVEDIKGL